MTAILRAAALLFVTLAAFTQTPPARFSIEWDTNHSTVRMLGPVSAAVQKASDTEIQTLFPVSVEPENILTAIDLPALAGRYKTTSSAVEFQAQFPFQPGVAYRASFTPEKLSSVLRIPAKPVERSTLLAEVYPTSDILPQNLLKFYLYFSAPMSRGHIYEHIHLLDQDGHKVELPFLEIDEELWNPAMTRLTLFLDPGRIKRGVRPLEEVGPALLPDRDYTLEIASEWPDAHGAPLKTPFHKKFHVTTPDREPPDPTRWRVAPPKRDTREPLIISFPEPLDQALALRMIALASVEGQKSLAEHEKKWLFRPDQPWKAGEYKILVQSTIEDLAGNNIGIPFEVDLQEGSLPRPAATIISLPFKVE